MMKQIPRIVSGGQSGADRAALDWRIRTGLCGVFLARTGPEETQIEASFRDAIRIAKHQKSVSLEKRAEGTCTEYHRKKRTRQEDVDSR